jgi:hypothetical protein
LCRTYLNRFFVENLFPGGHVVLRKESCGENVVESGFVLMMEEGIVELKEGFVKCREGGEMF